MPVDCPFCSLPQDRIISENESTVTICDGYPVSDGHTLVIPKRHVESFFDCNPEEKMAISQALEDAKVALEKRDIGVNRALGFGRWARYYIERESGRTGEME